MNIQAQLNWIINSDLPPNIVQSETARFAAKALCITHFSRIYNPQIESVFFASILRVVGLVSEPNPALGPEPHTASLLLVFAVQLAAESLNRVKNVAGLFAHVEGPIVHFAIALTVIMETFRGATNDGTLVKFLQAAFPGGGLDFSVIGQVTSKVEFGDQARHDLRKTIDNYRAVVQRKFKARL